MFKYYRGCSMNEAVDLHIAMESGKLNARRSATYWTDSFEKAAMYARRHHNGAVVEIEMDEEPLSLKYHMDVAHGDSAATTIRQWVLPTVYLEDTLSCFVEETTIHSI